MALAILLLGGLAVATLTDAQEQIPPNWTKAGEPDVAKGVWVVRFEPTGIRPRESSWRRSRSIPASTARSATSERRSEATSHLGREVDQAKLGESQKLPQESL